MGSADEITGTRGNTLRFQATIKQAPPNEALAFDLTGADLWFTVKKAVSELDAEAVISKVLGNGISVVAPAANGIALITLAPTDTASLAPGLYAFDLQVKSGGAISTPIKGTFVLEGDVTRAT